jgi:predicted nucleotidyltransferase
MAAKHPRKAEEVLNSLKRLKLELQARYYVKNIGLFGSFHARTKKSSDVDILVEFSKPIGFFKFLELEEYLETV